MDNISVDTVCVDGRFFKLQSAAGFEHTAVRGSKGGGKFRREEFGVRFPKNLLGREAESKFELSIHLQIATVGVLQEYH